MHEPRTTIAAQLFGLEKMPFHEFNDINLNHCWLEAMCPVSAGTGLSQHVDELRNHWSGYRLRLPGSAHRHPRSVLGRQIAENDVLGGYLLPRLAYHRHSKARRHKGERARGARLLTKPPLSAPPFAGCSHNHWLNDIKIRSGVAPN